MGVSFLVAGEAARGGAGNEVGQDFSVFRRERRRES